MRIGYILAGLLFFINPNILVVDLLPDFIGVILILYGIAHAAEVDERMAQTRRSLYVLLAVGIGRFLCTFLTPIIAPSEYTWFLVFAFCFGIGEAYLFCKIMYMLDSGLTYLSLKCDSVEIYRRTGGTALGMTIIFTVLKSVFSILPALTYLATDYGTVSEFQTNWTFVMWLLMALNVLVVTVYGILWYLRMRKFWKPLKNGEFLKLIEERYEKDYLADRPLTVYRDLKRISRLLWVGFLFAIPLRLDGMDVLPDFVAGVIFIFALRYIRRMYPALSGKGVLFASLYSVVSVVEWVYMLWFVFSNYSYQSLEGFSDVMGVRVFRYMHLFTQFSIYVLLIGVKLALLLCMIYSMRRGLVGMIEEHTGSITDVGAATAKTAAVHRSLKGLVRAVMVYALPAVLVSLAGAGLFLWVPIISTLDLFVWVAFTLLVRITMEKLITGIDDRYYYDT